MDTDVTAPITVVLGTRPEIIKLTPLLRLLGRRATVVHTGQHYDRELSDVFLAGLPEPRTNLGVGGRSRLGQLASAAGRLDVLLARRKPDAIVVQGDTNSALAGALAANAFQVPLVHVEAGLRSHDRAMPEEHNRVLVDHVADLLIAPTETAAANLTAEGIPDRRIRLTGNTIVEAVTDHLPAAANRLARLAAHGLEPDRYVLATIHRPENTDDEVALGTVLTELAKLAAGGWPVVLPLHPRTARAIDRADTAGLLAGLRVIEPVGYAEFLSLARHCALLVSDSGGLQEEATVLKRPLLVLRRSTERPESMGDFARLVPGGVGLVEVATEWLADVAARLARLAELPSPYGDGTASAQIAAALRDLCAARYTDGVLA